MNITTTETVFLLISLFSLIAIIAITLNIRKMKLDNKNDERYQNIVASSTEYSYATFGVLISALAICFSSFPLLGINMELKYVPALLLLICASVEILRLILIKKLENKM